jgi:hypothetical protein
MRAACFLLGLACAAGTVQAQEYLNCHFAPGWEQSGAKRQYTAENLYDYRDGGAEGYLIFGFTGMTGIDCKSGTEMLAVDVSEMTDADAAYGLFTANRDSKLPVAKIGIGGQVQSQSASFAKGKYYVELVVTGDAPESGRSAMLEAFARKMEERIEGRTTPPEALEWFPKENLTSARLIPESVLGLRLLKRGYVAKYKQGQAFIVLEDSPESAAEVMKKLRARFDGATEAKVGEDGFQAKAQYLEGICVFRKGRFLGGYANLSSPQEAVALAIQLASRVP